AQLVDRYTTPICTKDVALLYVGERSRSGGEDRSFRMLGIIGPQGCPNGLDAPAGAFGQQASDLALTAAGMSHLPGPRYEFIALLLGELAKLGSALDALGVVLDEAIDAGAQKSHSLATIEHQATAHQS